MKEFQELAAFEALYIIHVAVLDMKHSFAHFDHVRGTVA